jgi:hypothetical protein
VDDFAPVRVETLKIQMAVGVGVRSQKG